MFNRYNNEGYNKDVGSAVEWLDRLVYGCLMCYRLTNKEGWTAERMGDFDRIEWCVG